MIFTDIKLGDCLSMIENGVTIKQKEGASGYPITRIETLSNDRFNRDRLGYADIENIEAYTDHILDNEDLIMSHINSRPFLGRTVIYLKRGDEKIIHGMNVLRIKTNRELLNPFYAYYYFKTPHFRKAIDNIRTDAINQSSINTNNIKDITIHIPSITSQNSIVNVLRGIDKKIEINEEVNAELEAMAKQLYDYWFVQFDFPDENGNPYKSSGGKMEYNEKLKREIPEGWGAKPISNFIEHINTGLNPRQNFVLGNGNIKYITVKNLRTDGTIDFSNCDLIDEDARAKVHKRSGIQIKDILFASIAPLGRCHIIMRDPDDWDINESVFSIRPKQEIISPYYLYIYFMSDWFVKKAEKESAGSIFAGIRVNSLMEMPLLYAPQQIFESFEEKVDSLFIKRELLSNEINYLTQLRDSILPMLMNGQVTVE